MFVNLGRTELFLFVNFTLLSELIKTKPINCGKAFWLLQCTVKVFFLPCCEIFFP